jgi:large subunit ribosomal protein L25
MSELTIEVQRRETAGKGPSRRLRAAGLVPAVVYGGELGALSIQVQERAIYTLLRASGENSVFLLKLAGSEQSRHTMIKELQVDPLTGGLVHIDFQRIDMSEKVRVKVPLELMGVPLGVKNEGGMIDFVTRELEVECLPAEIPNHLELDVSALHIGQHLEAADVQLPESVELIEEPHRVVVSIAQPRLEAAAGEEEAEEMLEAQAQEPEVIGKGKEEEGADEG